MVKNVDEILEEIKRIDESEYQSILEDYQNNDFNVELYFDSKIAEIIESISEFGYKDDKSSGFKAEQGWDEAYEWFRLALKYKFYNDLRECLVDIWQSGFALWVDENDRGTFKNFVVTRGEKAQDKLKELSEYIFNVKRLTSKLSMWWFKNEN